MIKHFVGEHLTVSLIEEPATEEGGEEKFFVRIAKELDISQHMDLVPEEWGELAMVFHMMEAARQTSMMQPRIVIAPPTEEDPT